MKYYALLWKLEQVSIVGTENTVINVNFSAFKLNNINFIEK